MKPRSTNSFQRGAGCEQRSFPRPDYSYQSVAEAVESPTAVAPKEVQPAQLRPFWRLSGEYFALEATRDYVAEAIFFAWIAAVAAWPVTVMAHQLMTMMISPHLTGKW